MEQKKNRRFWGAVFKIIVIVGVGALIYGAYRFGSLYSRGFRPFSDANPSKQDIEQWSLPEFNPVGYTLWNKNPNFDGPNFHTGLWQNSKLLTAPDGKEGWAVGGYGWIIGKGGNLPITGVSLSRQNGIVRIFTKTNRGKGGYYGNGVVIQGWIWDSLYGEPQHFCPSPLLTFDKDIVASFDVKINRAWTDWTKFPKNWQMFSVSFWFKSEELEKPFVIDLAFYLNGYVMWTHEGDDGYHYQRVFVADKNEAVGEFRHYNVNLSWFIEDALRRFGVERAADSFYLYQIEALSETKFGLADFEIDSFYLYFRKKGGEK